MFKMHEELLLKNEKHYFKNEVSIYKVQVK